MTAMSLDRITGPIVHAASARCPDELLFDIEEKSDGTFTAVLRLVWSDEPGYVRVAREGFATRQDAEDLGCKALFDKVRAATEANGIAWTLGENFRPRGAHR